MRITRSSTVSILIKWDIRPNPSKAIGIKVKPTFILITLIKSKIKIIVGKIRKYVKIKKCKIEKNEKNNLGEK